MDNLENAKQDLNEDTLELLNMFYSIQEDIYNKYKNNSKTTIYEIYLYKVAVNAISILRNNYLKIEFSITQIYSYKILFESYIIMLLYKDSKEDLYDLYTSYDTFDDYNYLSEEDKKEALSEIKDKYIADLIENDQDAYLKLIKEKLPFLLDDFSFEDAIIKYNDKLLSTYEHFKFFSQPVSCILRNNKNNIKDFESDRFLTMILVIKEVSEHYENLKLEELTYNINSLNFYQKKFISNIDTVCRNIELIAQSLEEIKYLDELKNTLLIVKKAIKDITYDAIYNQNEVVTSKFKLILETISVNYQFVNYKKLDQNFLEYMTAKCIEFSKIYMLKQFLDNDNVTEKSKLNYLKQNFDELVKNYNDNFVTDFNNAVLDFSNPINYFMDNKDEKDSNITSLVSHFIDNAIYEDNENEQTYSFYNEANKIEKIRPYYYAAYDYSQALFFVVDSIVFISTLINKYLESFRNNKMLDDKVLHDFASSTIKHMDKTQKICRECNKLIYKFV